jgi:cathepsin F
MKLAVIVLLSVLGMTLALRATKVHAKCNQHEWSTYKSKFEKVYASEEEDRKRFTNFCNNLNAIDAASRSSGHKATFGLNRFSDMSAEEFASQKKMPKQSAQALARSCLANGVQKFTVKDSIPKSFNWVDQKNIVNPVQDQEQCGSCWAFSTIANIESVNAIQTGVLRKYSEQMLVDCSHGCSLVGGQSVCNQGCDGGFQWNAMQDVLQWGGVVTEASYPYQGVTGTCQVNFNANPTLYGAIYNYTCLSGPTLGNEAEMASYLVEHGPLSIAMNAGLLQSYTGGVLDPWFSFECDPTTLDHAVLIVGYGTDSSDGDFWIIRNSWAASWGEAGYFRIARGKNTCGLASAVVSVNVHKTN